MLRKLSKLLRGRRRRNSRADDTPPAARPEALEKRVLFSADLPWVSFEGSGLDAFEQTERVAPLDRLETAGADEDIHLAPPVLIVDRSYAEAQQIEAAELETRYSDQGVTTHYIASDIDGIDAVRNALEARESEVSLTVATTATDEGLRLGNSTLSVSSVLNRVGDVSAWRGYFGAESYLRIYASDVDRYEEIEHFRELLGDASSAGVEVGPLGDIDALDRYIESIACETEHVPDVIACDTEIAAEDISREIVFIDPRVEDYEELVADILANGDETRSLEIVLLDPERDGAAQIQAALAERSGIDAIHIVSHASVGGVQLGSTWLTEGSVGDFADEIAGWSNGLAENADLLIYGCDLAASTGGTDLLQTLRDLTGADVAASSDPTGHRLLDGDWQLEYSLGYIEAQIAFTEQQQAAYAYVLAAPVGISATATSDGGLTLNTNGGNDAYLLADDGGALLGGLSSLTFEIQFQTSDTASFTPLVSYASPSNSNEFAFVFAGTDAYLYIADNDIHLTGIDYSTLRDGSPQTLSVTWDNTSGDWAVYHDGVLIESGTGHEVGNTIEGGGVLIFGNEQDSLGGTFQTDQAFQGTLLNARFFDDVRTETEIVSSFQSALSHDESGMIAQWTFDDLSTDGVVTETVSGNNLTVTHTAEAGFTAGNAELTFQVGEHATPGTVVGTVVGQDPEREAQIAAILASDPTLYYSAETGKFYQAVSATSTWGTAQTNAIATTLNGVSGQLVTIHSANENQFVNDIQNNSAIAGGQVWLGASDSDAEGNWRWYDGSTAGDQFWAGDEWGVAVNGAYQNWLSATAPNDNGAGEDAAYMLADGTWEDNRDNVNFSSIIEWNADDVLDATQPLTYSIQSQTVAGAFTVDADSGQITVADGSLLDYEINATHNLTLRVTDVDGNFVDEVFAVSLGDVVETATAPTDLSNGIELNTDGGNDAYLGSSADLIGGLTSFTVEASFSLDSISGPKVHLVDFYNLGGISDEILLSVHATGAIEIAAYDTNYTTTTLFPQLLDGEPHHLAFSWDSTNGDWAIYIDGEFAESGTGLAPGATLTAGSQLGIGQEFDDAGGLELGVRILRNALRCATVERRPKRGRDCLQLSAPFRRRESP